jgi:hypothetical protein
VRTLKLASSFRFADYVRRAGTAPVTLKLAVGSTFIIAKDVG